MHSIRTKLLSQDLKVLHVDGSEWHRLRGCEINYPVTLIHGCGNIHLFEKRPRFFSDTVILSENDKNFIYYWLRQDNFPLVKRIVLDSHPCAPEVLDRFANLPVEMYVSDSWGAYVNRWVDPHAKHAKNITVVPTRDVDDLIAFAMDRRLSLRELDITE